MNDVWHVPSNFYAEVRDANDKIVAVTRGTPRQQRQRARMIAAAPELLEMLRVSVEVLKKVTPSIESGSNELLAKTIETSLAVIAKATGATP